MSRQRPESSSLVLRFFRERPLGSQLLSSATAFTRMHADELPRMHADPRERSSFLSFFVLLLFLRVRPRLSSAYVRAHAVASGRSLRFLAALGMTGGRATLHARHYA